MFWLAWFFFATRYCQSLYLDVFNLVQHLHYISCVPWEKLITPSNFKLSMERSEIRYHASKHSQNIQLCFCRDRAHNHSTLEKLSNPGWHKIRDPCNRGISDGTDLHQKYPVMPTDVHIFGLCLTDFLFFPFTWQVQIMWKLRFAVYAKQLNSHYLQWLSLGVHHCLCGGLFLFFLRCNLPSDFISVHSPVYLFYETFKSWLSLHIHSHIHLPAWWW